MHLTVGTKNFRSTPRNPSSKLSLVITPKPDQCIKNNAKNLVRHNSVKE